MYLTIIMFINYNYKIVDLKKKYKMKTCDKRFYPY